MSEMTPGTNITEEERQRESGELYSALLSEPPKKGWWGAALFAVAFHVVLFLIVIPEKPPELPKPPPKRVVNIAKPKLPPPPKKPPPKEVVKIEKKVKKLPIPDKTPEEPEPIKEPEPDPPEPEIALDFDFDMPEVAGPGGEGFVQAKVSHQVKPQFPQIAKTANIREAEVEVLLTIGTDGKVKDVRFLKGLPIYEEAVVTALKQWTFTPATQGGKAVESTFAQKFVFRLE